MDITDPVQMAEAVSRALSRAHRPDALHGGLALGVWGEPRETRDSDFATLELSGTAGLKLLQDLGLDPILSFERVRFGGVWITRTTALDPKRPGACAIVDWISPRDETYARAALKRALVGRLRRRRIRILSPEDYVVFKALSSRDLDTEDAASVLVRNAGRLDLRLVASCVRSLARAIPDHDVRGRWEAVKRRAQDR